MVRIGAVLLLMLMASLSGCQYLKMQSEHRAHANACHASCLNQSSQCVSLCDNSCSECIALQRSAIKKQYNTFIKQQTIQGGLIARGLKSYRDPLQCRKTTCNCVADYHECMRACTR